MNTFGTLFRLTSFGESHGAAIGGVIDGCPAGLEIDLNFIQSELDRRRPGQSRLTTARQEGDRVELLSGVMQTTPPPPHEGEECSPLRADMASSTQKDSILPHDTERRGRLVTTGTPIGFIVRNADHHSSDYDDLRDVFRPSHADFTYYIKYGLRDHRGGGRSSARETISRVVAGAVAKLALCQLGIDVKAWTQQVGDIACERDWTKLDLNRIEDNAVRCPDPVIAQQMEDLILQVKGEGDTIGGIIAGVITGCPVGLGEPVFGKLHAQLGAAMLSINAVKGFEYGEGFAGVSQRGSEQNDRLSRPTPSPLPDREGSGHLLTAEAQQSSQNHSTPLPTREALGVGLLSTPLPTREALGVGLLSTPLPTREALGVGLLSTPLPTREALGVGLLSTPLPTREALGVRLLSNHSGGIQGGISNGQPIPFRVAFKPVATLLREQETVDIHGNPVTIHPRGRHDPCVLPRAVPIVEAMAAMTILDAYLLNKTTHL